MSEHWSEFFKAKEPESRETGGVTLATTTDTWGNLNQAVEGRRAKREAEPTFFYTRVGPSLTLPDGTIEHGDPQIRTDVPQREPSPEEAVDLVGPLSPEQEAAAVRTYESQLAATRSAYPDFEETMARTQEQIPVAVTRFIVTQAINGPLVARYLAQHPIECERLRGMLKRGFLRSAERYTEEISAKLASDGSFGMDTDDYRTYRQKRDFQIRTRR